MVLPSLFNLGHFLNKCSAVFENDISQLYIWQSGGTLCVCMVLFLKQLYYIVMHYIITGVICYMETTQNLVRSVPGNCNNAKRMHTKYWKLQYRICCKADYIAIELSYYIFEHEIYVLVHAHACVLTHVHAHGFYFYGSFVITLLKRSLQSCFGLW
jgi:hypothetical protein